jgi:hypothetical protein
MGHRASGIGHRAWGIGHWASGIGHWAFLSFPVSGWERGFVGSADFLQSADFQRSFPVYD